MKPVRNLVLEGRKIQETFKQKLNESHLNDYTKSSHTILVGRKTNLYDDMLRNYKSIVKKIGSHTETYFFDKGFHFATMYTAGRTDYIRHDGTLDEFGRRHK